MSRDYDPALKYRPFRNGPLRVMSSLIGQKSATQVCPTEPRLDGRLALVTGGARGIGREIARGLARRGADVIAVGRSVDRADDFRAEIERETGARLRLVACDLSDLTSVERAVAEISAIDGLKPIDVFCANAGLSPKRWSLSADGHEIAFATNCLGHHALLRGLEVAGLLSARARIVGVTGDIYALASDCTPNYRYRGRGLFAYCRSKLGNLWQFSELARRRPEMGVVCVHPGVVATELEGGLTGVEGAFKRAFFISPEAGAQAPLIAATQPLGGRFYFHNMRGFMDLPASDAAMDGRKAALFWDLLESLSASALSSGAASEGEETDIEHPSEEAIEGLRRR